MRAASTRAGMTVEGRECPRRDAAWLDLLHQAVAEHGSKEAVAQALGYSRTAVSLTLAGKYGDTEKIARRVVEIFGQVPCPHLGESLTRAACDGFRARAHPTSSAAQAAHWRACRTCVFARKDP